MWLNCVYDQGEDDQGDQDDENDPFEIISITVRFVTLTLTTKKIFFGQF